MPIFTPTGFTDQMPTFFQPKAVSFSYDGNTYTLPNNPSAYTNSPDTIVSNFQTVAGPVTFVWSPALGKYQIVGVTADEGISVMILLKKNVQGKKGVQYLNALDGSGGVVLVTSVVLDARGTMPSTWRYTINFQDGQAAS